MEKLLTAFHHDSRGATAAGPGGTMPDKAPSGLPWPQTKAARSASETMKALVWNGTKSVSVATVPKVALTEPGDALVRVTCATVCGSDLHLYHNEIQGLTKGDSEWAPLPKRIRYSRASFPRVPPPFNTVSLRLSPSPASPRPRGGGRRGGRWAGMPQLQAGRPGGHQLRD